MHNLVAASQLKGYKMDAKYKLDALRIYKVLNAYGIVEAEKEIIKLSEVRNLKLWELTALKNEVRHLMKEWV